MHPGDSVLTIKGVGPAKAKLLQRLNISTIYDLAMHVPRDYQDRRQVVPIACLGNNEAALTSGVVVSVKKSSGRFHKKPLLRVLVETPDSQNNPHRMEVLFFHANYLETIFKKGMEFYFYGIPKISGGQMQMIFPEFQAVDSGGREGFAGCILPIYPLTAGLSQRELRKWIHMVLDTGVMGQEPYPREMLLRMKIPSLDFALLNVHFPEGRDELKAARYRLVFDEFFLLQLGIQMLANSRCRMGCGVLLPEPKVSLEEKLPFSLTPAQQKVMKDIREDFSSGKRMNRLVQGDVGSGKTVMAALALYQSVAGGTQGVMMAPTEILAKQHAAALKAFFEGTTRPDGRPIVIELLTSGIPQTSRRNILKGLEQGEIDILVGTHAVLQPDVAFQSLGLAVTDEQHRFGVEQRITLTQKSSHPHTLVMTATPIPRTLALTVFGDMDVSVLDEKPPGRMEIKTMAYSPDQRNKAYGLMKHQLEAGHQVFVVAPTISQSEMEELHSAEELYEELAGKYPNHRFACLHGNLPGKEKNRIMDAFARGEIQALVSTVVIEVGVDVPNATLMIIENAERFGLSQLHQLRGRVGRGMEQSSCALITYGDGKVAKERAEILVRSSDGFEIAEQDLTLRGPGEFFGTMQHGLPQFRIADFAKHLPILEEAGRQAAWLLREDPDLKKNTLLKEKAAELLERGMNL